MLLYISSFIIFIFVSANLFLHLHSPVWLKITGSLLVLFISLKYEVYNWLGGAFFSPALPRNFLLCMEALYGSLIILFFLLLLYDLYLLGNWLLSRIGFPIPERLPLGYIRLGLVILALGAGCFGTWQAVKVPDVHSREMKISNLPPKLNGFKIVQLSDLHIGPILKKDWLAEVVAKTNALKPDLIALTGDYVDGHVDELLPELAPLGKLQAPYGILGVTGNHEYYWDAEAWIAALKDLGIDILRNEHRSLNINGSTLVVAGLPDLVAERFGHAPPDISAAFRDAPEGARLLLAHQPKPAEEYAKHADLHLAGHTHGGLMFFLQPLVARFNSGFVAGLYDINHKNLYVSPGTGLWNGFSCRLGVPAEITLITLRPEESQNNARFK